MTTRIVTFLGLGGPTAPHYSPCRYELDGQITDPTPMHDAATVLGTGEPTSLVVIGTKEVQARWFGADPLFNELLGKACNLPSRIGFHLVPQGRDEAERWQLFEAIRTCLWPDPLVDPSPRDDGSAPAWTEPEPPTEIILDVTHGFRSQPVFGMAVAGFVASQLRRESRPVDLRVLYALFERDVDPAPVLDLTQLLDVMAWDNAIDSLRRHGRADDLERLLDAQQRTLMRRTGAQHLPIPPLQKLGGGARSFANGLVTIRTGDLLTRRAPALDTALTDALDALTTHIPPLRHQVEQLQTWARRLQADIPISPKGLAAMLELAKLYQETQRTSELCAILRELLISAWTLATLPEGELLQPGNGGKNGKSPGFNEQREAVEKDLQRVVHATHARGIPRLVADLSDLRNDVLHAAFRTDPLLPDAIIEQLAKQLDRITAALAHRTFVACSNHPVSRWATDQLEAATALGYGPPLHLDFPNVDPDADERALAQQADTLCDALLDLRPAVVFISGEFGLTMATVQRLHDAGVICVSATTRRDVIETQRPDGATERQTVFRFVRWRRFLRR